MEALGEGAVISVHTGQSRADKDVVVVDIYDNGPGISEADLPYIFDPFFSSKKKGTGLGLYNVKKVVEAHGGAVSVTSVVGEGTHFRVSLPMSGRKV